VPTGRRPVTLTGTGWLWVLLYGINIAPASVANVITSAGGTVTLISPTTIYLKNTGITYSGGASYGLVFDADTALAAAEVYLDNSDTLSTNGGYINLGGGKLKRRPAHRRGQWAPRPAVTSTASSSWSAT